jgi:uncharacterized protein YcfJ
MAHFLRCCRHLTWLDVFAALLFQEHKNKMNGLNRAIAFAALSATLATPFSLSAQTYSEHREAQREQDAHDARHHNTAKVVGGTAAGGAVIGAIAGGGKGALIGGAAGAGAGLVADKVRKHEGVKKRERRIAYHDSGYGHYSH